MKFFKGQEGMMGVDTPASLGLSLVEVENQRTNKRPRMSSLKMQANNVNHRILTLSYHKDEY